MQGAVGPAAGLGSRPHAALANDEAYPGPPDELLLELLHAHRGGRPHRDDFEPAGLLVDDPDDRAGVEDRPLADVDGQLAAELDEPAVRDVAAGDDVPVQEDDVADPDALKVLALDRRC